MNRKRFARIHRRARTWVVAGAVVLLLVIGLGCSAPGAGPVCEAVEEPAIVVEGPLSASGLRVVSYLMPRAELSVHDSGVAPDGSVWYTDNLNSCIGRFDPETMTFGEHPTVTAGSDPHGLAVDADGYVWYAATPLARVGRINVETGERREFTLPSVFEDVHSLLARGESVWFTAPRSNLVGRLRPETGDVDVFDGLPPGANPYGIAASPDGSIWITLSGSGSLGRFMPGREELAQWPLANTSSDLTNLVSDVRGHVWYTDFRQGTVGVLNPESGEQLTFQTTSDDSLPRSITLGPDGRIWFFEEHNQQLVGLDPESMTTEAVPIEVPGVSVRRMVADHERRRIWLALGDAGGVAVLELP